MNETRRETHDILREQLKNNKLDLIDVILIPETNDPMTRSTLLQEMFEDFKEFDQKNIQQYLVRVRPSSSASPSTITSPLLPARTAESTEITQKEEDLYLSDGALNVDYLLKNAEILCASGDFSLARNIYRSILSTGESTSFALSRLGRCFEAEGKLNEAKAHYEESIAYQANFDSYQRLISLLIRQKKYFECTQMLKRALNLKDIAVTIRFELHKTYGNTLAKLNNTKDAEEQFQRALAISPSADEIRSNLGALYLQIHKTKEAKRHFQDALASNPRNSNALTGLGSCFFYEGDARTAHDYFVKALLTEVNNPTAIFYLIQCAYQIKSYSQSERLILKYIEAIPFNSNLLYSLAAIQYHLGKYSESRLTAQQIIAAQPEHVGANKLLELIDSTV